MKDYGEFVLKTLRYLEASPSLEELQARYPEDWGIAETLLAAALKDKDKAKLDKLIRPLADLPRPGARTQPMTKATSHDLSGRLIRQRMTAIAIERYLKTTLTLATGDNFSLMDRFILRALFFEKDGRRKQPSVWLSRLLWGKFRKKSLFRPYAEARGVYCFYSKAFVKALAAIVGERACLEIGAGDGVLAAELERHGAVIMPTDDHSWANKIKMGANVERITAADALQKYRTETVLCSWPPARNPFEELVFAADHVTRYIVIGSKDRNDFGNWHAYSQQTGMEMRHEAALSELLLPDLLRGAVYIFERTVGPKPNL